MEPELEKCEIYIIIGNDFQSFITANFNQTISVFSYNELSTSNDCGQYVSSSRETKW